jgi:hypothetical protein
MAQHKFKSVEAICRKWQRRYKRKRFSKPLVKMKSRHKQGELK